MLFETFCLELKGGFKHRILVFYYYYYYFSVLLHYATLKQNFIFIFNSFSRVKKSF